MNEEEYVLRTSTAIKKLLNPLFLSMLCFHSFARLNSVIQKQGRMRGGECKNDLKTFFQVHATLLTFSRERLSSGF